MKKALLALLMAAGGIAGCVDEEASVAPSPTLVSDEARLDVHSMSMETSQADVCSLLPCDGACSLACDYDALVDQYVPKGSCVTFVCELTDGRKIIVDACHPPS